LLRSATEGPFSLRRGLEPLSVFSNEHHLSGIVGTSGQKRRRRPGWVALALVRIWLKN
jgi:hypothetical protein